MTKESLETFILRKMKGRSPETVTRYAVYWRRFRGWLGTRPITSATVQEYATVLGKTYAPNSLTPIMVGLNYGLAWSGAKVGEEPLRFRIPPREISMNARLVEDVEYAALLKAGKTREDQLLVRLLRESGWRPSDLMGLEVSHVNLREGILEKVSQKTRVLAQAILTPETADLLDVHLKTAKPMRFVFERSPGVGFTRTYPNAVLGRLAQSAGLAAGISPRTFRRTLATRFEGDLKDLMVQGGWAEPKTVLTHYRRSIDERRRAAVYKTFNVPAEDPDVPGYN